MKVYDFTSTSEFLRAWLRAQPKQGHGELRRIATKTGIHTTTLSQIFKGDRPLSLEQAVLIGEHLGLNELDGKYFLLLLQKERAGNEKLRSFFQNELEGVRQNRSELVHLIRKDKLLTDTEKAIFYSNWYYAGIAVLSSISAFQTRAALSMRAGISAKRFTQAVDFLLTSGICMEKGSKLMPGASSTHLESNSPLVSRHHANWRIKAMERHPNLEKDELAYSAPISISEADASKVREKLAEVIREIRKITEASSCEQAYFLNVDWAKF